MEIQENVSLKRKTTMRIGGTAAYYADVQTKEDVEQAYAFSQENNIPLITFGGGSNTIFADGTINALVIRIAADTVDIQDEIVAIEAGKNLPVLINELADQGLDLSPLTGILGTVGGAIFGNAGQGPKGIWIDEYVESVTAFVDGQWKECSKEECNLRYRESHFKDIAESSTVIIWSTTLRVPKNNPADIKTEIERLLQRRIETQPHVKTAGSCFKAVGDTPAWQLIDAVGLRGTNVGDVSVSEKHANFLINDGEATCEDTIALIEKIREGVDSPLSIEMRFFQEDGSVRKW